MKYIDDIIEFNSILDNKSSNILSMEDFNDLQILESSGSIFNKNWEKFFEYLYKLVLKKKDENKLVDITKRYTPEEVEKLYLKVTKDKFEEFGCKFPGGDKFDYIYVAVLVDPSTPIEVYVKWIDNTDEHPAYLGISKECVIRIHLYEYGYNTIYDKFAARCLHEINHQNDEFLENK